MGDEPTLSIALVQFSQIWGKPIDNQLHLDDVLAKQLPAKTDLVILPEAFSTGFAVSAEDYGLAEDFSTPHNSLNWLAEKAVQFNCAVCGSIIHRTDSGKRKNTFFWATPAGKVLSVDKRHLFALGGEKTATPQNHSFERGSKRVIIRYKGFNISPLICYDLRFPVWCRNPIQHDVDVLIFAANWPERRADAWNTLLRARSIENQCFVIGVNRVGTEPSGIKYSGDSIVCNPLGNVLVAMGEQTGIISGLIRKNEIIEVRNKFPFQQDADQFFLSDQIVEVLLG